VEGEKLAAKREIPAEGLAAFVDIETTGLSADHDEIIQLSIARFRFNRGTGEILEIEDSYTGFNEPSSGRISASATRVNGIRFDDVEGHTLNDVRINGIVEPVEFIVAHNASFDRSFLINEYGWANEKRWKCSMRHVDWTSKGYTSRALQKLLSSHGIKVDSAHRADADVKYALELLNIDAGVGTRYFLEIIKHRAMAGQKQMPKLEPAATISSATPLESSTRPIATWPQKEKKRARGAMWAVTILIYLFIFAMSPILFLFLVAAHALVSLIRRRNRRKLNQYDGQLQGIHRDFETHLDDGKGS
jgi:DNA polymerase-3 subunit epsilon